MVHDFIQLQREQVIDLRDARVNHHLRIFGDGHRTVEHLRDKFLYQVLAALAGCSFDAETALLDNLIEKAHFLGIEGCTRGLCTRNCFSHWSLLFHPSACPVSPCCPPLPAATLPACRCLAVNREGRPAGYADRAFASAASLAWLRCPAQSRPSCGISDRPSTAPHPARRSTCFLRQTRDEASF